MRASPADVDALYVLAASILDVLSLARQCACAVVIVSMMAAKGAHSPLLQLCCRKAESAPWYFQVLGGSLMFSRGRRMLLMVCNHLLLC
jgi:hypothetical protein